MTLAVINNKGGTGYARNKASTTKTRGARRFSHAAPGPFFNQGTQNPVRGDSGVGSIPSTGTVSPDFRSSSY